MNRLFSFIPLLLLIYSCSNSHKQLDNEKNILGDWVAVHINSTPNAQGITLMPPEFYTRGFTFYTNHIFDNKVGYYGHEKEGKTLYLGTISKFKILSDSILFFDPTNKKWNSEKLVLLTPDSLRFSTGQAVITFKHYFVKKTKIPEFDKIILSTSTCFGTCPVTNTIINSDGTVIFKGILFTAKQGLFTGMISKQQYQQLQDNFRKVDFDSLKNAYVNGPTDQQTITTTFIKNGVILKSVEDYERQAPYLFAWAYVPVENLYQTIALKSVASPEFIPNFNSITDSKFKKGDMILHLKQSETSLLFDYLRTGKTSNHKFKPRFKLHPYFDINSFPDMDTDGRFYTFVVKGKPITIDIGFNFYDENIKNWEWRKAEEYELK